MTVGTCRRGKLLLRCRLLGGGRRFGAHGGGEGRGHTVAAARLQLVIIISSGSSICCCFFAADLPVLTVRASLSRRAGLSVSVVVRRGQVRLRGSYVVLRISVARPAAL